VIGAKQLSREAAGYDQPIRAGEGALERRGVFAQIKDIDDARICFGDGDPVGLPVDFDRTRVVVASNPSDRQALFARGQGRGQI